MWKFRIFSSQFWPLSFRTLIWHPEVSFKKHEMSLSNLFLMASKTEGCNSISRNVLVPEILANTNDLIQGSWKMVKVRLGYPKFSSNWPNLSVPYCNQTCSIFFQRGGICRSCCGVPFLVVVPLCIDMDVVMELDDETFCRIVLWLRSRPGKSLLLQISQPSKMKPAEPSTAVPDDGSPIPLLSQSSRFLLLFLQVMRFMA